MSLMELSGLVLIYLFSIIFIGTLTYKAYQRDRFNFHILFSLLFLLTFYFGFPFTLVLAFVYQVPHETVNSLAYTLSSATLFYGIYALFYQTKLTRKATLSSNRINTTALTNTPTIIPTTQTALIKPWLQFSRLEVLLTALFLAIIALGTLAVFSMQNGILLFKLQGYNEIFSNSVAGVALKRFFYFFLPAMLILYFLKPTQIRWISFLFVCTIFGLYTYAAVGGTRANILIAFALFLFIGIERRWITLWMLMSAGILGIVGMFVLAIRRYGLDVSGSEAFYTFLYLTRDTFSPWQSVALLFDNYDKIELQGLAPIARDFYVFIPKSLWSERPDTILNAANYFTWEVLENFSGLAISPTLMGSLLIMGGVWFIPLGALFVAWVIKWFDWLYARGKAEINPYRSAILQAFCFGAIFNIIVLVREGIDSFVSRVVFFIVIFGICVFLAKLCYWLFVVGNFIRVKFIHVNRLTH